MRQITTLSDFCAHPTRMNVNGLPAIHSALLFSYCEVGQKTEYYCTETTIQKKGNFRTNLTDE
jgi:hypothetical protein